MVSSIFTFKVVLESENCMLIFEGRERTIWLLVENIGLSGIREGGT